MSLKVVLRPDETFVINGSVVRNGNRRSALVLENEAVLLRERDFPDFAAEPSLVHATYLAIMQIYLQETPASDPLTIDVFAALRTLAMASSDSEYRLNILQIAENLLASKRYRALSLARKTLIEKG